MRLAYLVNQYPKASHTFIRREIAGVERLGIEVRRFSVRRTKEPLLDAADCRELERTRAVLDVGAFGLARSMLSLTASRPLKFARALRLTLSLGRRSHVGVTRHLIYLAEACSLMRWLREEACEHVHAHFGTNSTTVAMLCHELGGPPYSFAVHGPEEFDKPDLISLQQKIERSAFVTTISSFGLSQLYRRCEPHDWHKLHIVRCGLESDYLDVQKTPVPSAPRLVCVGRLCAEKGQLVLIEAAAHLFHKGAPFEILFVGDGPTRGDLESAISRHGLERCARIAGWASGEGVREAIRSSRALVLPSFAEGLPVVLMEAFALGRPVITTFVAGIPELVVSGRSGWLVPAGSVDALAGAMREALAARPLDLERMAREGERRVRELHDVQQSARALGSLLTSVASSRRLEASPGRPARNPKTADGTSHAIEVEPPPSIAGI